MTRRRLAALAACILLTAASCEGNATITTDSATGATDLERHVDDLLDFADDTSGSTVGTPTAYWMGAFVRAWPDITFSPPASFEAVDGRVEDHSSRCSGSVVRNAIYCSTDHSITWDTTGLMYPLAESIGDFAPLAILAHEYGHHIQNLTDQLANDFTIEAELQADCYAGLYTRYADESGMLDSGDVEEGATTFWSLGTDSPWFTTTSHGTSEERRLAHAVGFSTGDPLSCSTVGDVDPTLLKQVGPWQIAVEASTIVHTHTDRALDATYSSAPGARVQFGGYHLSEVPAGTVTEQAQWVTGAWFGSSIDTVFYGEDANVFIVPTADGTVTLELASLLSVPTDFFFVTYIQETDTRGDIHGIVGALYDLETGWAVIDVWEAGSGAALQDMSSDVYIALILANQALRTGR